MAQQGKIIKEWSDNFCGKNIIEQKINELTFDW